MSNPATPQALVHVDTHADVTFTWDGWMQIHITNGTSVPWQAWPNRIDVREPDLRRDDLKSLFPHHPDDPSVHFIPVTQANLADASRTWMDGGYITAGRRDYTRYPWEAGTWGWICGALDVRYRGGDYIEATPHDTNSWQPIIDITLDGYAPDLVSTTWLRERVDGWLLAFLEYYGIDTDAEDIHDAAMAWTRHHLPTSSNSMSPATAWSTWVAKKVTGLWQSGEWQQLRDAGRAWRSVYERPWYEARTAPDGTRWNFLWTGTPFAYAYSPDLPASPYDRLLTHRPAKDVGPRSAHRVRERLTRLADDWMSGPALKPQEATAWSAEVYASSGLTRTA
ncbi:hypothetical protein AB0D90_32325 [Streptomyces althioticus]|uniref:Uncharacterized protein n=1 Tax=Streptomyces cellulosae TaxID=1968 RepID=A0ABW6JIR4_STRCE